MTHIPFDPSEAVRFDLAHGLVHLEGAPSRVLVPADALAALASAAGGDAARAFGQAAGGALGRRVAARLAAAGGVRGVDAGAVVEHLGGELALSGLGSLSLERWGRALVLAVEASPLGAAGDGVLGAVLAGALEAATGTAARIVLLGREGARVRFLIAGDAGAEKVRAWLSEGISWGDALARLHAASTAAAPRGDA